MQYTSLKDKNGKEIYEGDIFTVHGRNLEIYWCPQDACWGIKQKTANDVKVIGNIYENPELLSYSQEEMK